MASGNVTWVWNSGESVEYLVEVDGRPTDYSFRYDSRTVYVQMDRPNTYMIQIFKGDVPIWGPERTTWASTREKILAMVVKERAPSLPNYGSW